MRVKGWSHAGNGWYQNGCLTDEKPGYRSFKYDWKYRTASKNVIVTADMLLGEMCCADSY